MDEKGWFYVDEDTSNADDEMLTYEDDEYVAVLTTYTEARGALAKARIARGFYPVVVPADSGMQPRFGRTGGKGKGKGKGSSQPRPNAKSKAKSKAICARIEKATTKAEKKKAILAKHGLKPMKKPKYDDDSDIEDILNYV